MSVKIYQGDCRDVLSSLPTGTAITCVTSPPYYALRDYGVDGQVGIEGSPDGFIDSLVDIFSRLRRVLRDDGSLWLNIADTYAANRTQQVPDSKHTNVGNHMAMKVPEGMKAKDLMMIPAATAIALRSSGWYLRSDIIWHRPNVMPERVKDRPTTAHEHVFLLSKSPTYHYNDLAIAEATRDGGRRNARTVWSINTRPTGLGHHAAFPEELVEQCLLAGGAPKVCAVCAKPYLLKEERSIRRDRLGIAREETLLRSVAPCEHEPVTRAVVIDPFFGSGTTGLVAEKLGMDCIGIELNPEYVAIAHERLCKRAIPVEILTP